jgi:hypothetical protein
MAIKKPKKIKLRKSKSPNKIKLVMMAQTPLSTQLTKVACFFV